MNLKIFTEAVDKKNENTVEDKKNVTVYFFYQNFIPLHTLKPTLMKQYWKYSQK